MEDTDPPTDDLGSAGGLRDLRANKARGLERQEFWADKRREQLGAVNQGLFGVALAALVLLPQLLGTERFISNAIAIRWAVSGVATLTVSMAAGVGLAMVRLIDFRKMAEAAGFDADGIPEEGRRIRATTKPLGRWTWGLLWTQLLTASVGFLFLMVSLLVAARTVAVASEEVAA